MQPPPKSPFYDLMALMPGYTDQWRSQPETQQARNDAMLFWQTVMRTWMAAQAPSAPPVSGVEGSLRELLDRLSALEKRMMTLEARLGTPNL
ncbi:MAG: hypothetical protein ACKO43_07755 [Alphaproteobacteria bacterium]